MTETHPRSYAIPGVSIRGLLALAHDFTGQHIQIKTPILVPLDICVLKPKHLPWEVGVFYQHSIRIDSCDNPQSLIVRGIRFHSEWDIPVTV